MTTTAAFVDGELETRCLSFLTDDSPAQTRRVFHVLADLEEEDDLTVDFERWHRLQRWLADSENRVVIPYVRRLAELMPDGAPRLRRDFISVLCLTRASAILHQATRERDERGGSSRRSPTTRSSTRCSTQSSRRRSTPAFPRRHARRSRWCATSSTRATDRAYVGEEDRGQARDWS